MPEPTQTQTTIDADDVCFAVVETVAEATDTDVNELPPLYESIDPSALAALFEQSEVSRSRTGVVVFEMAGCTVTVSGTGTVSVTEGTDRLADLETAPPATVSTYGATNSTPEQVSDRSE